MLSAEIEGRSFGGGVLELVPSEVGRLAVPFVSGAGLILDELSRLTGPSNGEITDALVDRTDELLLQHGKIGATQLDQLRSARRRLQRRRLDRSDAERPAEELA
jgi:adenine-specific DNA-methyltransferase